MALDTFRDDDLNGECFIVGSEGELDIARPECKYALLAGDHVDYTTAHNNAWYNRFLYNNYNHLRTVIAPSDPALTEEISYKIAYLRTLAVKESLIDLQGNEEDHHCLHEDRINLAANVAVDDAFKNAMNGVLTADVKKGLRERFTNMVCLVAYIFRVRGHHYMDGFDAKYSALWRKCLYNEDDPGLPWKYIAVHSFHAIYPDKLDEFWHNAVENGECSGTMRKRYDCAPAGVAGLFALKKGIDDLCTAFSAIKVSHAAPLAELNRLYNIVHENRWAGSVNRMYYGAPLLEYDESALATLGALIVGALKAFSPNAPLIQSYALKRIANNAPIVTGVMENILEKAVQRDEMVQSVVPVEHS